MANQKVKQNPSAAYAATRCRHGYRRRGNLCRSSAGQDVQPVRCFGPFTRDLNALADWLGLCGPLIAWSR
jgi:hypothetical protein